MSNQSSNLSFRVLPASVQPLVTITDWSIRRLSGNGEQTYDHILGKLVETGAWRISSPIVDFNPTKKLAVTASGRTYQISSHPGSCFGATVYWNQQGLLDKSQDVTGEYWALIEGRTETVGNARPIDAERLWVISVRDKLPKILSARAFYPLNPNSEEMSECTPMSGLPESCIEMFMQFMGPKAWIMTERGLYAKQESIRHFIIEMCRRHKLDPEPIEELEKPARTNPSAPEEAPKNPTVVKTPPKPIKARGHRLVDPVEVDKKLAEVQIDKTCKTEKNVQQLHNNLQSLKARPYRTLLKVRSTHFYVLDQLERDFPNFTEVIQWVRRSLRLKRRLNQSLALPPHLLVGTPGCGKTEFARRLAQGLQMQYLTISIATSSATFDLHGSHKSWSTGSPGQIAKALIQLPDRQGLYVLLDEIDKVQDHNKNYPIIPVLLELLEPGQSDHYRDEYFQIPMNITPLTSWIATANDLTKVPAPLRSRLQIFHIPQPNQEQMPAVVRSVDSSLRKTNKGYEKAFQPLSDLAIRKLQEVSPRDIRRAVEAAYGICLEQTHDSDRRQKLAISEGQMQEAIKLTKSADPSVDIKSAADEPESLIFMMQFKKTNGGAPPSSSTFH